MVPAIVVIVRDGLVDVLCTKNVPRMHVFVANFDVKEGDDAILVKWPDGRIEPAKITEDLIVYHPNADTIVETGAL